ncbi:hypothetical protein P3L10_004409 [Capsicum annuum]
MYVATLRELLEQLTEERNPDGLPRSVCIVLFQLDNLEKMTCCYKSFQTFGFLTICDCFFPMCTHPRNLWLRLPAVELLKLKKV